MTPEVRDLFERAKQEYPERDPGVDSLILDLCDLPIVQERGEINAHVYVPVFDETLKQLRTEGKYTNLATILLTTALKISAILQSPPGTPYTLQTVHIQRETLVFVLDRIGSIAEYLGDKPTLRDKIY